jgi:hypothetical protein
MEGVLENLVLACNQSPEAEGTKRLKKEEGRSRMA